MSSQPEMDETKSEKETPHLFEVSRKVLLAAIGAVSLAQDELEDFVKKMVERGEIADKDGRKLVTEIREKRKKRLAHFEEEAHAHLHDAMKRMNIPTRKDIDDLNDKIADLVKKIDELKQTKE